MPHHSHPIPERSEIVPVAVATLTALMVPTLRLKLSDACWSALDVKVPRDGTLDDIGRECSNFGAFDETLRQAAIARRSGLGYAGGDYEPYVFLREWFDQDVRLANLQQPLQIYPTDQELDGIYSATRDHDHATRRIVANGMSRRWPSFAIVTGEFYDRFVLWSTRRGWKVSHVGIVVPSVSGTFRTPLHTDETDLYVLAKPRVNVAAGRVVGASIVGWCLPKQLDAGLTADEAISFDRIVVGLNCAVAGVDIDALLAAEQKTQEQRTASTGRKTQRPPKRSARSKDRVSGSLL